MHKSMSSVLLFCAECLIEENTSFQSNYLNDGYSDPRQNDVESCRSFCRSNYPTAKYFEWVGPFVSMNPETCWCKESSSGKTHLEGSKSGEVACGNNGNDERRKKRETWLPGIVNVLKKHEQTFQYVQSLSQDHVNW